MAETNCILTGREVEYTDYTDSISYSLKIGDKIVDIFICRSCEENLIPNPESNYIYSALIINGRLNGRQYVISNKHTENGPPPVDCETLVYENYLDTAFYPKTASEKMDNLLFQLFKIQKVDGESMRIDFEKNCFWMLNYFRNVKECLFYIESLRDQRLINFVNWGDPYIGDITLTFKGLNKIVELSENGAASKNCFIAMAFTNEMKEYREAIKRALKATGFEAVIIDETHLSSDKTIPDGILSGIKKSKFCIADFTLHRNGVYFESGYALGLGKPVIYVCKKEEFEKTHFDIKQLQHIIYSDEKELESRLIDKIEAWIK